jgi:hypothetical protein
MERADAVRLVAKLQALADPTRGGTDAERAIAGEKATRLIKRFGLNAGETVRPKPAPPRHFTAPAHGGAWDFDWRTGAHGPNVKVERYQDARNWKIEIF